MCQTSNFVRYSVLNREPAAIVIGGEEDSVGTDGWMTSLAKLFCIRCSECMLAFYVLCRIELPNHTHCNPGSILFNQQVAYVLYGL